MSTTWPTLKVRDGQVNLRFETTANENGEGFRTFLVSGAHKILFLQSANFEELLESLNVFSMAFGVLNYRIENTF
jgi:hypothetical protein